MIAESVEVLLANLSRTKSLSLSLGASQSGYSVRKGMQPVHRGVGQPLGILGPLRGIAWFAQEATDVLGFAGTLSTVCLTIANTKQIHVFQCAETLATHLSVRRLSIIPKKAIAEGNKRSKETHLIKSITELPFLGGQTHDISTQHLGISSFLVVNVWLC